MKILYVVCWRRRPLLINTFPKTQTIWQLEAKDEKSIPALKINILWDMVFTVSPNFLDHWLISTDSLSSPERSHGSTRIPGHAFLA